MRSTRSSSSMARMPTAPVWSTNSRVICSPLYWKDSRRRSQTIPEKTVSDEVTTGSNGSSAINADDPSPGSSGILEQAAGLLAVEGGADESPEQRGRVVRARPQLGVRLRSDVERVLVAGQLDEFDEVPVGRGSREPQSGVGDLLAVGVVDLVAVTVALRHDGRTVQLRNEGSLGESGRVQAEAHGAAQVAASDDLDLLLHGRDHGEL